MHHGAIDASRLPVLFRATGSAGESTDGRPDRRPGSSYVRGHLVLDLGWGGYFNEVRGYFGMVSCSCSAASHVRGHLAAISCPGRGSAAGVG